MTFAALRATPQNDVALKAAREVVETRCTIQPLVVVGPARAGNRTWSRDRQCFARAQWARVSRGMHEWHRLRRQLIAAVQQGTVERWRAKYRSCDAFVLDGIEAVADKELTQDELFHLFNALTTRGAQLVFASRHEPSALGTLPERVRSRLEGGLVVHVAAEAPAPPAAKSNGVRAVQRLTPLTVTPVDGADALPPGVIDNYFLDGEKIVVDWPDAEGLLIEEMR